MTSVMVTGGAGYIGSVLIRKLLKKGYKVIVLDCLRFGIEPIQELLTDPNFTLIVGDIRNKEDIKRISY